MAVIQVFKLIINYFKEFLVVSFVSLFFYNNLLYGKCGSRVWKKIRWGVVERTIVPIKNRVRKKVFWTGCSQCNRASPDWGKSPANVPNVQVVLNDDVVFGVSEVFGRLVTTPIIDKLAQNGIRYNLVYATVLCLPTHLAPLNGYYQDSNIMGGIAWKAKSFPGNPGAKL